MDAGKCPRCGVPFDDHKLPPININILPHCPPKEHIKR